jgi:hypothetical protein
MAYALDKRNGNTTWGDTMNQTHESNPSIINGSNTFKDNDKIKT